MFQLPVVGTASGALGLNSCRVFSLIEEIYRDVIRSDPFFIGDLDQVWLTVLNFEYIFCCLRDLHPVVNEVDIKKVYC